jgi:hypothetical protein
VRRAHHTTRKEGREGGREGGTWRVLERPLYLLYPCPPHTCRQASIALYVNQVPKAFRPGERAGGREGGSEGGQRHGEADARGCEAPQGGK